jgi:hypothetical protein
MGRISPGTPTKFPNIIVSARSNKSPVSMRTKDSFVPADEYDELKLELAKRDNAIQELTSRYLKVLYMIMSTPCYYSRTISNVSSLCKHLGTSS